MLYACVNLKNRPKTEINNKCKEHQAQANLLSSTQDPRLDYNKFCSRKKLQYIKSECHLQGISWQVCTNISVTVIHSLQHLQVKYLVHILKSPYDINQKLTDLW